MRLSCSLLFSIAFCFASCGDISDTELHRGEYFVGYYEDEGTKAHAERLIAYMDSAKTKFSQVKLHRMADRLLCEVEAEFPNAEDQAHHNLLAGHLAYRLSQGAFNGEPCNVVLVYTLDGDGDAIARGNSDDPRGDSVVNHMRALGIE